ncbi:hypothetical protein GCM10025783_30790 [Amnibacterium soli]|uniref:Bacterial Ig-like domain-containing protein n=1 Tax=Amnibacterium soli TaxID=1282736 RepID=A0ABP8ZG97_9MICO
MHNEFGTARRRRRFGITTAGCTVAVVVAGALAAPAAHASSITDLTTGIGSTVTGVGSAVTTTGTLLTGSGSTAPTTSPVLTTPILTTPVVDLPSAPTAGLPGLATVDGDGTGLTVDVGNGLVTVGAGTGSSTGSGISVGIGEGAVGATTGGSTTVTTADPTNGAPSVGGGSHIGVGTGGGVGTPTVPGAPTGGTSPAPAPSSSPVPRLLSATVAASVATVYPKKDGYRDTVSFLVKQETSTGAVIPVTGSAVLTKAGKAVKTWALVRSTQTLVWNGLVDGAVKPGTYLLRATARAGDGQAFTSSTRTVVSAKRLVTKSVSLSTGKVTKLTNKAMPKPARTSLVKGLPVRLRVITSAKGIKGVGKLVFTAGKKSFSVPVRSGKHAAGYIRVPRAFTAVHMRPVLKAKHGTVRSVKLIWKYGQLK